MLKAKKRPARDSITAAELQTVHDELLAELREEAVSYFTLPLKTDRANPISEQRPKALARCRAESLAGQLVALREMAHRAGLKLNIT